MKQYTLRLLVLAPNELVYSFAFMNIFLIYINEFKEDSND